jgi:uncharacterized protein YjbI with pentapeptide repeats
MPEMIVSLVRSAVFPGPEESGAHARRGESRQMDAQELVRRYKAGERSFSNVNLSGASLWAAYLGKADLSQKSASGDASYQVSPKMMKTP